MRREGSSGWAAAAETDVAHSEAADWARACRYPARICPVADAVMRPLTKRVRLAAVRIMSVCCRGVCRIPFCRLPSFVPYASMYHCVSSPMLALAHWHHNRGFHFTPTVAIFFPYLRLLYRSRPTIAMFSK